MKQTDTKYNAAVRHRTSYGFRMNHDKGMSETVDAAWTPEAVAR